MTPHAPTREELLPLIAAAGRVADHSSLRPWSLIELRGEDRVRLGAAIAAAQGDREPSSKPMRAELLIAVVASFRPSGKVPRWEQEAVASGVAHMLSLLLDEAGWGVIWRTGDYTRSSAVARAHGLGEDEALLGWLYVGGKPEKDPGRRRPVDAESTLSRLPEDPHDPAASPDAGAADDRPADATVGKCGKKAAKKRRKKAEEKIRKAEKKRRKKTKKERRTAAEKARRKAADH